MRALQIKQIQEKFNELKLLGETRQKNNQKATSQLLISGNKGESNRSKPKDKQFSSLSTNNIKNKQEVIDTQSDIAKELAKLKPYLVAKQRVSTSEELEQLKNRECSKQNYKMMCQLTIIQNKKLCEVLKSEAQRSSTHRISTLNRQPKEEQGWVFEIFYKYGMEEEDISKKLFISGYAVMSQVLQIFESLAFGKKLVTIIPASITNVKYKEQMNYDVIIITHEGMVTEIGFLNAQKFNIFDRMLFLQKNMSRSTSTRLFQNQLIKNIYQGY